MGVYLIYHINEALCIIPRETFDYGGLTVVREDGCYEGGALVYGKGVADQLFPGQGVTVQSHGQTNRYTIVRIIEKLTG